MESSARRRARRPQIPVTDTTKNTKINLMISARNKSLSKENHFKSTIRCYSRNLTRNMTLEEWISILCHPVIGIESSVIDRKIWGERKEIIVSRVIYSDRL